MRLLLDTHVFLWSVKDDRRLSKDAKTIILEADDVNISSASIWELAIKVRLKKINLDIDRLKESIFVLLKKGEKRLKKHAYLICE